MAKVNEKFEDALQEAVTKFVKLAEELHDSKIYTEIKFTYTPTGEAIYLDPIQRVMVVQDDDEDPSIPEKGEDTIESIHVGKTTDKN